MTGWRGNRSCWRGMIFGVLGVGVVLWSFGSVGQADAGERVVGYVVTVDGHAYRQGGKESQRTLLEVRRKVFYGDQLTTLAESKVQVYLWGDVVFVLGPGSQLELLAPSRGARERSLRLGLGFFRLLASAPTRGARLLVVTPAAETVVRGAEILGEVDEKNTAIVVLRGEAEVRGTAKGGTVQVRAGQGTDIAAGQDPTEPVLSPKERLERLREVTAVTLFW